MNVTYKIAVFASGNGTNAENIARVFNGGNKVNVALAITNRKSAGIVARMEALGIPCLYEPNKVWDDDPQRIVDILREYAIDIIVLAGFMHFVSPVIINAYRGRIVNIHPSLLPAHGGKGMYGHHVHEAVIAQGDKKSGVTVHHVTEEMDAGDIIMQQEVEVLPDDNAETLEAKIHPVEYELYPRAIMALVRQLEEETKSPDEEWADALRIKYDPSRIAPPPVPPVPNAPAPAVPPLPPVPQTSSAAPQQPQPQAPATPTEPMPPTYLALAVIMMICCCLPAGIVAIIFASQVSSKYFRGDLEGAKRSSRLAQIWIIVAFAVGVLLNTLYMPFMMLASL